MVKLRVIHFCSYLFLLPRSFTFVKIERSHLVCETFCRTLSLNLQMSCASPCSFFILFDNYFTQNMLARYGLPAEIMSIILFIYFIEIFIHVSSEYPYLIILFYFLTYPLVGHSKTVGITKKITNKCKDT